MIYTRSISLPPCDRDEALRYAMGGSDEKIKQAVSLAESKISGKVRYGTFPISIEGATVDFGFLQVRSKKLARHLDGCSRAVVFCATIGLETDKLIQKYMVSDISLALLLNAVGSERVETLCNTFCRDLEEQYKKEAMFTRPRFSPGYGDFPLSCQGEILRCLEASKIGVGLSESLLMTPSKSVTAVVGIGNTICKGESAGCDFCEKTDCEFRKV